MELKRGNQSQLSFANEEEYYMALGIFANPKLSRVYIEDKDNIKDTNKMVIKVDKTRFSGRDLHILLSSFVQIDSHFKCQTKTIYHEKSSKAVKGRNQWLHPDMVGVYYQFVDYSSRC